MLSFHASFRRSTSVRLGIAASIYLSDVWRKCAGCRPRSLANEVRDVLPTAYAYCLEELGRGRRFAPGV